MLDRVARGTKRKCQNDGCALSFYDLNRSAFDCPNCGSLFDLEADTLAREAIIASMSGQGRGKRWAKPASPARVAPAFASQKPDDAAEDVVDDPAAEVEDVTDDAPESPDMLLEDDGTEDDAIEIVPTRINGDGDL